MKNELTTQPDLELSLADHQRLGEELTSLYHDAVEGNMRILAFGARMLEVEHLVTVSTRGHGGKFGDKGTGLKAWLEEYAPEIGRSTAYRWRDIAEATAEKFKVDNPTLVFGHGADALDDKAKAKRAKVAAFVSEKSIRGLQLELGLSTRSTTPGDDDKTDGGTKTKKDDSVPFPAGQPYVVAADEAHFNKLEREQRLAWIQWVPRAREIFADIEDKNALWPHLDWESKTEVIAAAEFVLKHLSPAHAASKA